MYSQQVKIKQYTPDTPSYAPRIRNEQWEQHKSLLSHLHDVGYKRADMLEVLRGQNFNPSLGQLNTKMSAWGFKVYGTQPESPGSQIDVSSLAQSLDAMDTNPHESCETQEQSSPDSRHSISSITLCDAPESHRNVEHYDRSLTLDDVISIQGLAMADTYYSSMKPSDFGFKSSNGSKVDRSNYQSIIAVAEFLCAVHCFELAFDLYYHIFQELIATDLAKEFSLVRGLIRCSISATNDAQCAYVLPIIRRAQSYCSEHAMIELTTCFQSISRDLCTRDVKTTESLADAMKQSALELPFLLSTDPSVKSVAYQNEWLKQQLAECDSTCGTLAHLSAWCQDTLSFYRLESRNIVKPTSKSAAQEATEVMAFEHDFQILVSGLIIDYLNSPGPSMRVANIDCKDKHCFFRTTLSPSTSLIIMAHLLYEPLRLQNQSTSNQYLQGRAQQYQRAQTTTALLELKSFAAADSNTRCGAFVDVFLKHLNPTLLFRRLVANADCIWDRTTAAKRLAQVLQSNQTGILPHAGLPSARRSVLKTMVATFPHDPSLTEGRPSLASDSGSLGDFERFSSQLGQKSVVTGSFTPSDAMSIDTRSSWSFGRVTGFGNVPQSGRNSLSLRRQEQEEMEEYRSFIRDNNYSQQNTLEKQDTPTRRSETPTEKDF